MEEQDNYDENNNSGMQGGDQEENKLKYPDLNEVGYQEENQQNNQVGNEDGYQYGNYQAGNEQGYQEVNVPSQDQFGNEGGYQEVNVPQHGYQEVNVPPQGYQEVNVPPQGQQVGNQQTNQAEQKETVEQKITPEENKENPLLFYKKSSHPGICLSTLLFKIAALAVFIFLNFFSDKYSIIYLTIILLGVFDFWVIKNLSGRYLVGLRWWNEVKNNGEEVWIFESKNEKLESSIDRRVFWITIYGNAIIWSLFSIYELISLSFTWFIVSFMMLIFGVINLYGYFNCSKVQQKKIKELGGKLAVKTAKYVFQGGIEGKKKTN